MNLPIVKKTSDTIVEKYDWGELKWFACAKMNNSNEMTVGQCTLKPGRSNPMHSHSNCEEVLVVLQGKISHTIKPGEVIELSEGDIISIPAKLKHQAKNIGEIDAVLLITFSTSERKTVGE